MWRTVLPILVAVSAQANKSYRQQPCKAIAPAQGCVHIHGRLSAGSGTPATRLWQIGTHHIYGIYSNQYGFEHDISTLDNESPQLPSPVYKHIDNPAIWRVYGDFEVCPLESRIEGHMQAACLAGATHLISRRD
jgi:hypothetical protein